MEIESPIAWRKKVATSQSALQKKKANVTCMKEKSKTVWRQNFTVLEHTDEITYKVIFASWQAYESYFISKFSQIISNFFLFFFILFKRFKIFFQQFSPEIDFILHMWNGKFKLCICNSHICSNQGHN